MSINRDLHVELEEACRRSTLDRGELGQKLRDFEALALERLTMIHRLEAQVSQGFAAVFISKPVFIIQPHNSFFRVDELGVQFLALALQATRIHGTSILLVSLFLCCFFCFSLPRFWFSCYLGSPCTIISLRAKFGRHACRRTLWF